MLIKGLVSVCQLPQGSASLEDAAFCGRSTQDNCLHLKDNAGLLTQGTYNRAEAMHVYVCKASSFTSTILTDHASACLGQATYMPKEQDSIEEVSKESV
jgi:hypothetical protein